MVFQGHKMLWGHGAQRMTITCLQTRTRPSLRGRPAMWITSMALQGLRNFRMYDLPASSDKSTERWSQSNAALVLRWDCALTAEHCDRGAAGIPALTRAEPGIKAAETQSPCPIPYSGFTTGEPLGIPLRKWLAGRSDLWITARRTDGWLLVILE